jgi:hypothetical protein
VLPRVNVKLARGDHMFNKDELRDLITRVLKEFQEETKGLIKFTPEAVELLMMTCAHESLLGTHRRQIKGPALGIFQMEPDTFNDIQKNFIEYRKVLKGILGHRKAEELVYDDELAIKMARVLYFRAPEAIGKTEESWAALAKKRYNTVAGKATEEKYLNDYRKYA